MNSYTCKEYGFVCKGLKGLWGDGSVMNTGHLPKFSPCTILVICEDLRFEVDPVFCLKVDLKN